MTCHGVDWDCDIKGCFNQKKRLKFSAFKPYLERAGLPGKISFSDIDGFFERRGFFFFVEWKGSGVALTVGQKIAFEKLTALSERVIAYVVEGDAEFMTCESWTPFYGGRMMETEYGCFHEFCSIMEEWAKAAEAGSFNPEVIERSQLRKAA